MLSRIHDMLFSGMLRQPKWGHLKDLHAAIKLCEPALIAVDGSPQYVKLGSMQEVCCQFLAFRFIKLCSNLLWYVYRNTPPFVPLLCDGLIFGFSAFFLWKHNEQSVWIGQWNNCIFNKNIGFKFPSFSTYLELKHDANDIPIIRNITPLLHLT
jgi:hypothetical protein